MGGLAIADILLWRRKSLWQTALYVPQTQWRNYALRPQTLRVN